jgi:hypothetical protein
MGHRDTLLCDTTYLNATNARSATRERVRRNSGFVQVGFCLLMHCTCPKNGAGLTGQCNTGLQFTRRRFKAQGHSRALIEAQSYLVEIGVDKDGESAGGCEDGAAKAAWNWNTLACFQMEPGSARTRLILPKLETDVDPRIAIMCSVALPIVNRPLSFGSHLLLDGGLESNLPAGHLLDQGMSGGNCAICVIPCPLSSLDPCAHVDFRTLKFLSELKNIQQTSRMKVLGTTSSVHPAHTLRPVLLIQPDQELKSGLALGFFRPNILRQEFEEGYQQGQRLSAAMTQFKLGDDEALSAHLLESCGLLPLDSRPPRASFWKYWVNSRWN